MATATLRPLPADASAATRPSPLPAPSPVRLLLIMVAAALAIRLVVVACLFRELPDPAGHYERFGNEVGWIARGARRRSVLVTAAGAQGLADTFGLDLALLARGTTPGPPLSVGQVRR